MDERHEGICEFERRFPQGLLCDLGNAPEGRGCVYLITNLLDDKMYVGQTWWNLPRRWQQHLYEVDTRSTLYFHKAIRKHGRENFVAGVLAWADNQDELDKLETLWIAVLGTTNRRRGYNLTHGGRGGKHTEATKEKLGNISRACWTDPEYRQRRAASLSITVSTPEYKARHSKQAKDRWNNDPLFRQKCVDARVLTWTDPEYQRKISESMKEKWQDPAYVKKQGDALAIATAKPEYKAKKSATISVALNTPEHKQLRVTISERMWADPEYIEKQKEGINKPEVVAKLSAALKNRWEDPDSRAKMIAGMRAGRARKKAEREREESSSC